MGIILSCITSAGEESGERETNEIEKGVQTPPMLDKDRNTIEGLAFIGLSLSRNAADEFSKGLNRRNRRKNSTATFHPDSVTRQKVFDFNQIQDRDYKYFQSTNDDGWLVGGGEGENSYKLPNTDSAHCEIMRIGTFEESLGGVSLEEIIGVMESGVILIPHFALVPSLVQCNENDPPEVELKFNCESSFDLPPERWNNWQLLFLHNQLFRYFQNPGRFCPGPFHMTFVRKATFRSLVRKKEYAKQL